jgi:ubiquinone/menaquinone biosynthesis C-methylase UbiE
VKRDPFTSIAGVYDDLMVDVDYDSWIDYIFKVLTERGWTGRKILELGCGTGNAMVPMFSRGFRVTGLDASQSMLDVARPKLPGLSFVRADFEDFSLSDRFNLVYSVFDTLNNLLKPKAFANMAQRVFDHLEPAGAFVFDLNTTVGLREPWVGNRIEGSVRDVYYRWEHSFDEERGLARVEVFWKTNGHEFTEVHFERAYDGTEVQEIVQEAGFMDVEVLAYPSGAPAPKDAPRVWVVAKKGSDPRR